MKIKNTKLEFDNGFTIILHRTIRLPEDGNSHALPPSMGPFPMKRIEDFKDKVPVAWKGHGGVFIPMYEREAMWLGFDGTTSAVKIATGKVNAVSGDEWSQELKTATERNGNIEQDYMVGPSPQPWLDGFNTGKGQIKQFVAMAMGKGYTVEAQVTGKEDTGGIQILVVPSKPGKIPVKTWNSRGTSSGYASCEGVTISSGSASYKGVTTSSEHEYSSNEPGMLLGNNEETVICSVAPLSSNMKGGQQVNSTRGFTRAVKSAALPKAAEMGLAQGGMMVQKIYEDPHGIDTWDQEKAERIFVHIVNAQLWEEITGEKCPSSPVSASDYKGNYYKYDNGNQVIKPSAILGEILTISEKDKQLGFQNQQDDNPLNETKTNSIVDYTIISKDKIKDGVW